MSAPTIGAHGAIAQLEERLLCKQEVAGSIPAGSTSMTGEGAETNVERLRRLYEGEDIAVLEVTDDAEFVNPPEAIEPGIRRGAAEVTRALRKPYESFDTTRYEVHDLFDAGDTVVASVDFSARVGGSDSEIVQEEVHTWTFRDGKVARFEWGRDLDAALAAGPEAARRRLVGMLSRRGYPPGLAYDIVSAAMAGRGLDPGEDLEPLG